MTVANRMDEPGYHPGAKPDDAALSAKKAEDWRKLRYRGNLERAIRARQPATKGE
jgi:hypothetical protein